MTDCHFWLWNADRHCSISQRRCIELLLECISRLPIYLSVVLRDVLELPWRPLSIGLCWNHLWEWATKAVLARSAWKKSLRKLLQWNIIDDHPDIQKWWLLWQQPLVADGISKALLNTSEMVYWNSPELYNSTFNSFGCLCFVRSWNYHDDRCLWSGILFKAMIDEGL